MSRYPELVSQGLEESPNCTATDQAPEHVVLDLILPEKLLTPFGLPACVVLEISLLRMTYIQPPVQTSGNH